MGFRGGRTHYDDPAYYSYAYRRRRHDVRYYQSLIEGNPKVLEYGVGNGRVAIALARAGATVTGMDTSLCMLQDLRQRLARQPRRVSERVRIRHGDMRRSKLAERFELVVAPFNTIQHLYTAKDFERFLSRVSEHLAPGAGFVFDFSLPRPADLARTSRKEYKSRRFHHPGVDLEVDYFEHSFYDPKSQLLRTKMRFVPVSGRLPWNVVLTQRQWFPREIEALLHYRGFGPTRMVADFDPRASFEEADTIVVQTRVRPPSKPPKNAASAGKRRVRPPLHEV